MNDTSKLRKRIGSALANEHVGSAELFELISETEQAANEVNAAAAHARAQSVQLDADPTKAAHAIAAAGIEARQLQRAAQQLHDMLPIALSHEQIAKFTSARDRLQPELDALGREAEATIRECFDRLIEVFGSINGLKERARRELPDLPPNTATLQSFHPDLMRVLEKTQLFDFDGSQIWPTNNNNAAVAMVQAMQFPSHSRDIGNYIGPGWENMREQFQEEKQRETEREAERYADMTREQEQRQNAEERQKFSASQRR